MAQGEHVLLLVRVILHHVKEEYDLQRHVVILLFLARLVHLVGKQHLSNVRRFKGNFHCQLHEEVNQDLLLSLLHLQHFVL